jgi:hypothetical protein
MDLAMGTPCERGRSNVKFTLTKRQIPCYDCFHEAYIIPRHLRDRSNGPYPPFRLDRSCERCGAAGPRRAGCMPCCCPCALDEWRDALCACLPVHTASGSFYCDNPCLRFTFLLFCTTLWSRTASPSLTSFPLFPLERELLGITCPGVHRPFSSAMRDWTYPPFRSAPLREHRIAEFCGKRFL